MVYLFTKGTFNADGSFTIKPEFVARWQRQMQTQYNDLPEDEKESDRKIAEQISKVLEEV